MLFTKKIEFRDFLKMGDDVFLDQYLKMVSYAFIAICIMKAIPYSIY